MESLVTYEGTAEIQSLIVGRDITGQSAFVLSKLIGKVK
jgi:glutaryl-CoA dehydrogenase